MKLALVQIYPWERASLCEIGEWSLSIGDRLLIATDTGTEVGRLLGFKYLSEEQAQAWSGHTKQILGLANADDCHIIDTFDKSTAMNECQQFIDQCQLEMKLVDAAISADGHRLTFAFIAEGRVDFRELVRLLSHHFNCQIRLQQIGTRDEAKIFGGRGVCGRPLCCSTFLTELSSITSDVAGIQGVSHRGSERISGVCGRLMCCLAYEAEGYKELAQKLPEVGSPWKIEGESGTVISRNILKGTIMVELSDKQSGGSIVIEVDPLKLAENTPSLAHRRWKKHQAN